MNASFTASLSMIIVAFIVTLLQNAETWLFGGPVMAAVPFAVLGTVAFYYAQAIAEEADQDVQNLLEQAGVGEWYLRVLSQTLLLGLPLSMQFGPVYLGVSLVLFYWVLLKWDSTVFPNFAAIKQQYPSLESPYGKDIAGMCFAIMLLVGFSIRELLAIDLSWAQESCLNEHGAINPRSGPVDETWSDHFAHAPTFNESFACFGINVQTFFQNDTLSGLNVVFLLIGLGGFLFLGGERIHSVGGMRVVRLLTSPVK